MWWRGAAVFTLISHPAGTTAGHPTSGSGLEEENRVREGEGGVLECDTGQKRKPLRFLPASFFFFVILFHSRQRRAASSLTWARLVHPFISEPPICSGSASLLREEAAKVLLSPCYPFILPPNLFFLAIAPLVRHGFDTDSRFLLIYRGRDLHESLRLRR